MSQAGSDSSVARVGYRHSLESLEASLQEQGSIVLRAVRGAIDALESQDVDLCDEVIRFDDEIDLRYHRIEKSIEEEIAKLAAEGPTADELAKARNATIAAFIFPFALLVGATLNWALRAMHVTLR